MPFNLTDFRSQMVGQGARPTLFEATLNFPTFVAGGANAGRKATFMCQAANLPGSTLGSIELSYFGRKVKIPGDRTFDSWTVTIINDEDFAIRNSLENWMNNVNSHAGNTRNPATIANNGYGANLLVKQYGKAGDVIKVVNFVGAFPTTLSAIDLSWETNNSIETYTCEFQYQWWESVPSTDGTVSSLAL